MRQNVVNYQFWIYCQVSWSIFFFMPHAKLNLKPISFSEKLKLLSSVSWIVFHLRLIHFQLFVTLTKYDNDVLLWKNGSLCMKRWGYEPPPSMAWKNLKLLLVNHWWPKPSGGGGVVNGASCGTQWLIQLPFCRFTEKFNICSCHRTDADIFEPPTKSAKWYFVILWHFGSYCWARYFPDGAVARFTSHSYPTKSVTI